ncbi:3397_t:CDS:2 [Ambispora leptoticha]|uniref:3397_t:CDS:1 n=1 Tax=Ambispora leptoticha TaxID=144679 RepID=A0A9N9DL38_9GLOM|nr:3397_t:CDS:2 [Ambispora leptoticha]
MTSLLGLVARFSRPTLRTLRPIVFSLTSQKRNKEAELFSTPRASKFLKKDMEALRVSYMPASDENDVIPNLSVTNSTDQYAVPHISRKTLKDPDFKVDGFICITDPTVRTFFDKLHDAVFNGLQVVGTDETFTDTLVDDLLRIAELNENHPPCKLYINNEPVVSAVPEFVVRKQNYAIIGVEDKHLKNVGPNTGFGETQIAADIIACGYENMRLIDYEYKEQTIFAIRVISTYVTFYKTEIPAIYWKELEEGLPKVQSIEIRRWPAKNSLRSGFDLAEPSGRETVLKSLLKIRQFLVPK